MSRRGLNLLLTIGMWALAVGMWNSAWGEVTVLQNGVRPTTEYMGCKDTLISDEAYERNRDYGRRDLLPYAGQRHILIQFDLQAIPKGHTIHQAVLRLSEAYYLSKQGGKLPSCLLCYAMARPWQDNANWREHTRTNYDAADQGDWQTPGGDLDLQTDFGQGEKGLVGQDRIADGPWGQMHEFDVTEAVRRWHEGQMPNHGLLLRAADKSPAGWLASSEWYVPEYRPQLVIEHGPPGTTPVGIKALECASAQIELHPISATPDVGPAQGDYAIVRVGQNSKCEIQGRSTDTYIKEAVNRFGGSWGWMTMCRVGGRAGDFSRALLYFDLASVPKTVSIQKAELRVWLTPYTNSRAGSYRYGAFLVSLPEEPGWDESATPAERRAGTAWPTGGLTAASAGPPLALGQLVTRREANKTIPEAMIFDLTGVVRAWVQGKVPNCGVVLDNRIEGGAYDFYSCRSPKAELRPWLEITLSPPLDNRVPSAQTAFTPPEGDYWVEPMREAHKRFTGTPGTLAQYGDSITVTMAFLAGFSWTKDIAPANCPPEVKKELDVITQYSNRQLWRDWKGGEWGNTGMMKSDWLLANIDTWQKKMTPEVAVIMFGTNDTGDICPPEYTENMAAAVRRMLADGTVPMLTTIPPKSGRDAILPDYWEAIMSIGRGLQVPVIDFYSEILRRRPQDWDGRLEKFAQYQGYDVPTLLSRDGVHPSNPKQYVNDFSEEALNCSGYGLRNYLTLRKYYEVIAKVLAPGQ